MEILRYVLMDKSGDEGDYEYDSFDEAKRAAKRTHAVIERTYVYDDSTLAWTPDGSTEWPPQDDSDESPSDD